MAMDEDLDSPFFDHEHLAYVTHVDRIRVKVKTKPDLRPTYVFQLECRFLEDDWVAVIRYDDFHDRPHIDRLHADGTQDKIWQSDQGENKQNMIEAQQSLLECWQQERSRYESEFDRQ